MRLGNGHGVSTIFCRLEFIFWIYHRKFKFILVSLSCTLPKSIQTCSGPIGRDVGLAICFPMGCMIAHTLCGRSEAHKSIEVYVNALLDTYCTQMIESGKTMIEMEKILCTIAGTCGYFMFFPFYILKIQDSFPVEAGADNEFLRDALGILGLKLMNLTYNTVANDPSSFGMDVIRNTVMKLLEEEVTRAQAVFASRKSRRQPRKSSMLRATNRRVSDTEMLYLVAESVRRFTVSHQDVNQCGAIHQDTVFE